MIFQRNSWLKARRRLMSCRLTRAENPGIPKKERNGNTNLKTTQRQIFDAFYRLRFQWNREESQDENTLADLFGNDLRNDWDLNLKHSNVFHRNNIFIFVVFIFISSPICPQLAIGVVKVFYWIVTWILDGEMFQP